MSPSAVTSSLPQGEMPAGPRAALRCGGSRSPGYGKLGALSIPSSFPRPGASLGPTCRCASAAAAAAPIHAGVHAPLLIGRPRKDRGAVRVVACLLYVKGDAGRERPRVAAALSYAAPHRGPHAAGWRGRCQGSTGRLWMALGGGAPYSRRSQCRENAPHVSPHAAPHGRSGAAQAVDNAAQLRAGIRRVCWLRVCRDARGRGTAPQAA